MVWARCNNEGREINRNGLES